jgi:poly-gamma-glutamate synthesis protein (capsule biosynthesis protein)
MTSPDEMYQRKTAMAGQLRGGSMGRCYKAWTRGFMTVIGMFSITVWMGACQDKVLGEPGETYMPPALTDIRQPIGGDPQTDPLDPAKDPETWEAAQESVAAPKPISVTISAAGDVSLGNHQEQDYANSFRQTYDMAEDKGYFFQNVKDIFEQDDFTLVNLEGVLTFSERLNEGRTYYIKGDPDYAQLLVLGGIEGVSMGNNHKNDYGQEGINDTVEALKTADIAYAYDNIVGIYETKGITIGFVSVNESSMGEAVEDYIQEGITKLEEERADIILVYCHWGIEKEYYPEDYQKELGHKCIDWGADLVLGSHPHVLQGIEYYQGKYIVYSLANFCFGANRNPPDKDTMIFQQTFTFPDGVKEAGEARVIPCTVSSVKERNDFCPTPATGEEANRILGAIQYYSQEFHTRLDGEGYLLP